MRLQRISMHSLPRVVGPRHRVALLLVTGLTLILGAAAPVLSQCENIYWTGNGTDNLWSNPMNWEFEEVPEASECETILSTEAEGVNGPIIQDGIEAVVGVLTAAVGEPVLTMTGGSLEATDWGIWWGDAAGTMATFNMSGGEINLTGNPGILESGWLDDEGPAGTSGGVWNISGGVINAKGISMPTECPDDRCFATVNFTGGTINVGTAQGGMILRPGAMFDVAGGTLVLEGDQREQIELYIDDEYIKAYGGTGELVITYNAADDLTTVVARSSSIPGDYNKDGQFNEPDLNLQAVAISGNLNPPEYDLNKDGKVSYEDRVMWCHDLKNVYIGDANLDNEFNSADFVQVFVAGKYETDQPAGWAEGDFDGDLKFGTADFVAAFVDGGYETGVRPAAVSAVPEPGSVVLALVGLLGLAGLSRRRRV